MSIYDRFFDEPSAQLQLKQVLQRHPHCLQILYGSRNKLKFSDDFWNSCMPADDDDGGNDDGGVNVPESQNSTSTTDSTDSTDAGSDPLSFGSISTTTTGISTPEKGGGDEAGKEVKAVEVDRGIGGFVKIGADREDAAPADEEVGSFQRTAGHGVQGGVAKEEGIGGAESGGGEEMGKDWDDDRREGEKRGGSESHCAGDGGWQHPGQVAGIAGGDRSGGGQRGVDGVHGYRFWGRGRQSWHSMTPR